MKYIKDIMTQTGVDKDTATQIYMRMTLDFSECTEAEFMAEVDYAYGEFTLEQAA